MIKLTIGDLDILNRLQECGGTALRQGAYFEVGGQCVAPAYNINGLRKKKVVTVHKVGESTFVDITELGRNLLQGEVGSE